MTRIQHFAVALRKLGQAGKVSDTERRLLVEHCQVGECTPAELGRRVGWRSYQTTNARYGKLGRLVHDLLPTKPVVDRYKDGSPLWVSVLASISTHSASLSKYRWKIRPELKSAIAELGWLNGSSRRSGPPRVWLVKARQILKGGSRGWHWDNYFKGDNGKKAYPWGGADWIRSAYSKKLLREEVAPNDILVAYQVDDRVHGRCILGLTLTRSGGKEDRPGSGQFDCFDIAPAKESLQLCHPLPIERLYAANCRPLCLRRGSQGTFFPLPFTDFGRMVEVILHGAYCREDDLTGWCRDAGFLTPDFAVDRSSAPNARQVDVDAKLDKLEKIYATKSDLYVAKQVRHLIRHDRAFVEALKMKYGYGCQFPNCKIRIPVSDGGWYCEVAHLKPAARGGQATRINLVVLCPNHHKSLDYGDVEILSSTRSQVTGILNGKKFRIVR